MYWLIWQKARTTVSHQEGSIEKKSVARPNLQTTVRISGEKITTAAMTP